MARKKAYVQSRRQHSAEFKAEAVKMSMKQNVLVRDVAEELNISVASLSKWRKDHLASKSTEAAEKRVDAIAEAQKLREENKRLKMELEILKKAAAYFASHK